MSNEIENVLQERGAAYGDFLTVAYRSQSIQSHLRLDDSSKRYGDAQREALQMIASKLARIASGDANHRDSWVDIAGYAQLAADSIPKPKPTKPTKG